MIEYSKPEVERVSDDITKPVLWSGRQWAVTAEGLECWDGQYFITKERLLHFDPEHPDFEWPDQVCSKRWVDVDDFLTAWLVAIAMHRVKEEILPSIARAKSQLEQAA